MKASSRRTSSRAFPWLFWLCLSLLACSAGSPSWAAAPASVPFALTTRPQRCSFSLMDQQGSQAHAGTTPFIGKVKPGRYRLVVTCPGHLKEARSVDIRKATVLSVAPFPAPSKSPPRKSDKPAVSPAPRKRTSPKTRPRPAPRREAGSVKPRATPAAGSKPTPTTSLKRKRPIPWVPIVTGGALLIAGSVFFLLSQNSLSYAGDRNNFQLMAYREHLTARDHQSTSFFLLMAGGVALAISGVMVFWGWPSKRRGRKFYDPPKAQLRQLFPAVGQQHPVPMTLEGNRQRW